MNMVDHPVRDNTEIRENEKLDVKVEDENIDKSSQILKAKSPVDKATRYPYQDELMPPVYMSTIAQSSSYDYLQSSITDRNAKYVTTEYQRQYQSSPPSIDKAPSFVSRILDRCNDADVLSSSTAPPSPSTTPPEDKHVWSKGEVETLLDMYETYKDQLKDPRVRKTKVWEDIARVIRERLESDVNGCQCNQKFRNLKADFQKVMEHNGRPGNFKRVCKYYDRLANILNYPVSSASFHNTHTTYSTVEHRENGAEIPRVHYYYENGVSPTVHKVSHKRKLENLPLINGVHNGHTESYYPAKKAKPSCNCECSNEISTLRETIERVNNYVVARSAHEEERMRRLEDIHREKLIALSRFVDVFKDFIHKMT